MPTSRRSTSRLSIPTPGPAGRRWTPSSILNEAHRSHAAAGPAGGARAGAAVRARSSACRPTSPTSTRRPTSGAWRSAESARARSGGARRFSWCRHDGSIERVRVSELYVTEALDRVDAEGGRRRRDHLGGRHPRDHDRRHAGRRGGSASAAGDHRRRALAVGDDRDQLGAAGRTGRNVPDRQPDQYPAPKRELGRQTCRCESRRPTGPRYGRSRAAASWRWRSSWS